VSTSNLAARIIGWRHYDSGGPQIIKDSVFTGFTSNSIRYAACIESHVDGALSMCCLL
jgi:hypothetical protein